MMSKNQKKQSLATKVGPLLQILTGEVLFAGTLSKILLSSPDAAFVSSLFENEVFLESPIGMNNEKVNQGLMLINTWFGEQKKGIDQNIQRGLKIDYDNLFFTNGGVTSPYESVYLSKDHLLFEEQTILVRRWYAKYGLQAEQFNQIPDDHIGLELSFLGHLAMETITAIDQDDEFKVASTLRGQLDFLKDHPTLWVDQWADRVNSKAATDYYRGIALLVAGGINSLLVDLSSIAEID